MAAKKHLIVTGVARSGTTALAELLNTHEEICLGIERYKFQYLRHNSYSADFFERDRFFDFREEDTNLRPDARPAWKDTYDRIAQKWDKAKVIGDKVPDLTPVLADLLHANPDYKCIFILRNLKDVGLSWQARADRVRDTWPAGKGFEAACESWAEQTRLLHEMVQSKEFKKRILVLNYDTMYTENRATHDAILKFLHIGPSAAFSAQYLKNRKFMQSQTSEKIPPEYQGAFKSVDRSFAKALVKRSGNQIARRSGQPKAITAEASGA